MRRLVIALSLLLVAATADQVVPGLRADGYYIEAGAGATEQVVSDAVFDARSAGGRLYLVVLAEEPPGGATTFSDSVLDELGEGYVVTVAPVTVGYAGDGSFWSAEEMDAAIDSSLGGGSDDRVIELFVAELTGAEPESPFGGGEPDSGGGGLSGWVWMLIIGGGALLVFLMTRRGSKRRAEAARAELEKVKVLAREKLADIANDIIEMEDEVELSDHPEVKAHYQRASATYGELVGVTESAPTAQVMIDFVRRLDMAIWELDAAEALLDGKPIPDKPEPPQVPAPRAPEPAPRSRDDSHLERRPERHSSYSGDDLMGAIFAILAMTGRGGGWGGLPGGFGGPMRPGSGGTRMRGGGFRMRGMGRMRGGGRRR